MRVRREQSSLFRRVLTTCAWAAALLSCGRDATAPYAEGVRFARSLALAPVFPPAYQQVTNALAVAPFTGVRVVFLRASGATALDTLVAFPANADSLALTFAIPLSAGAPASGEPLTALLYCIDAQGDTVFRGGPIPVVATTSATVARAVQMPLRYTGVGANATSVHISPKSVTVTTGGQFSFTAAALDANGQVIAGTPIIFRAIDATLATLASPAGGTGRAIGAQGSTLIVAQLITGAADSAILAVQPTSASGPATKLSISVPPSASVASVAGAVIAPAIVVQVRDSLNNVQQSFSGNVTLSLGGNPGGGSLGGTTTVAAVNGIATFSDLSLRKAGAGYRLAAASGALTPDTSAAFTVIAAAASSLAITGGSAQQTGPISVALPTPLSVTVSDAFGNPVSLVNVVFASASGGGAFSSTTVPTNSGGVASAVWTLGSVAGAQSATATVAGLSGSPALFSATAIAGGVASLTITGQPTHEIAGTVLAPAIVVQAKDASGNLATSFNGTVSLSFGANAGGDTLRGTTSVAAVGGVATFANVSLNRAASGYKLVANASGLSSDTSAAFAVSNAAAAAITASAGSSGQTGLVGTLLPTPLAVIVTDAYGNPVTGAPVTWVVSAGGGSLGTTASTTNSSGVASTTWTLGASAGTATVTATSALLPASPVTFASTAIASILATNLTFAAQLSSVTAGALPSPVIVQALNAAGGLVTSYTGSVKLSFGTSPGGAALGGVTTVNAIGGVATFANDSINKAGTGYTLMASASGLPSITSATFGVTNAAAALIAIQSGNNQSGLASLLLAKPIAVLVTDAFGNPVAGETVTWTVAAGGGSLGTLSSTTNSNGVDSTTWTLGALTGAQTVTAVASGLPNSPLTFSAVAGAGAATKLIMAALPGNAIAGVNLAPSVVVTVEDALGNVATTFTGPVTLSLAANPAAATLGGTTTVNAVAGVARFTNVSLTRAASGYILGATSGTLSQATSSPFTVTAASAASIATTGGNGQSGAIGIALGSPLTVTVSDAFGNPVSGVSVGWSVAAGGGSLGSGATTPTNSSGIATNSWILGGLLNAQVVTANVSGLAGPPATFAATAVATHLVITLQPAGGAAGSSLGLVVTAEDASGNVATSFTGAVSLAFGANPGADTLFHGATVNAVAGVATFTSVAVGSAAAGYTLVASSSGLTSATTGAFSITAAAPALITKVGGDLQSGLLSVLGIFYLRRSPRASPTHSAIRSADTSSRGR